MIVPFGAIPGFSLAGEMREVAAHYDVNWKALRFSASGKAEAVAWARHALFWKLHTQHKLSHARIGQLLKCSRGKVREGVVAHIERIKEFQATSGIKGGA